MNLCDISRYSTFHLITKTGSNNEKEIFKGFAYVLGGFIEFGHLIGEMYLVPPRNLFVINTFEF